MLVEVSLPRALDMETTSTGIGASMRSSRGVARPPLHVFWRRSQEAFAGGCRKSARPEVAARKVCRSKLQRSLMAGCAACPTHACHVQGVPGTRTMRGGRAGLRRGAEHTPGAGVGFLPDVYSSLLHDSQILDATTLSTTLCSGVSLGGVGIRGAG